MQFIAVTKDVVYKNPVYGEGCLQKDKTYYTFGQFARETAEQGFAQILDKDTPNIIHFQPPHLQSEARPRKIILMFSGGLGDAISVGIVLPSVVHKYHLDIDICCSKDKWDDIFRPMGINGRHIPFPPDLETLSAYDAIWADVTDFFYSTEGISSSPVIQLLQGFNLEDGEVHSEYQIPQIIRANFRLPPAPITRIGFNADSNGLVKSYPEKMIRQILETLLKTGSEIYIFGAGGRSTGITNLGRVIDLRGKTSVPELAALLDQMDIVLGVDSFIAHLSNLLRKPTIVLLSTTAPSYFKWHSDIDCISSKIECAPCFAVLNKCPRGYPECRAFYHESVSTKAITDFLRPYLNE